MLSPAALRAVDFLFTYDDPAGQGFFDPVVGDQRRAALNAGANLIGQLIRPTYGDETGVVCITSVNDPMKPNTLAFYSSGYFYADFGSSDPRYQTATHYPKPLASHLLGGQVPLLRIGFKYGQFV